MRRKSVRNRNYGKSRKRNVRKSVRRNVRKSVGRNVRKKNYRKSHKRNVRKSIRGNIRKGHAGGRWRWWRQQSQPEEPAAEQQQIQPAEQQIQPAEQQQIRLSQRQQRHCAEAGWLAPDDAYALLQQLDNGGLRPVVYGYDIFPDIVEAYHVSPSRST